MQSLRNLEEVTDPATPETAPPSLAPAIRASLNARLERLLRRPIIARIVGPGSDPDPCDEDEVDAGANGEKAGVGEVRGLFDAFVTAVDSFRSKPKADNRWVESAEDGTCSFLISLDYDVRWRGCEKEILNAVNESLEGEVAFLTEAQRTLLEQSPREFLALMPRPEVAELVAFGSDWVGGGQRVAGLTIAATPKGRKELRYVAIIPNLVQLERQLQALQTVEASAVDGPLAPLRALIGLPAAIPYDADANLEEDVPRNGRLDEFQALCVRKATATPHFAVIHGPPGSGKTTVIEQIVTEAVDRGESVLVVSPTHVAVDNVVEKLAPKPDDDSLHPSTLPVRYAAKEKKLSELALRYWVGSKKQRRAPTISRRLEARLRAHVPFADRLFAMEATGTAGLAPLSAAIANVEPVKCGTPIGLLSYDPVKLALPGSYGLLVVDEVSKMTLPEFLAIAVKARRWVIVGDPQQLPPYNDAEENAATLDDVIPASLEVVCSVGAVLERAKPGLRRDARLVVVCRDPARVAGAIEAHLASVRLDACPPVSVIGDGTPGIVVCTLDQLDDACAFLSPSRDRDRHGAAQYRGTVEVLVERGLSVGPFGFGSGPTLVEPRKRAQAIVFETAFNVYHSHPWSQRSCQKLRIVSFRNGLSKMLPSAAAIEALSLEGEGVTPVERRSKIIDAIAERFLVNTVSVYDWLTGTPTGVFDVSPLTALELFSPVTLREAVRPYVGQLKRQYRMDPSLSAVPRELFYFGEALLDPEDRHARLNRVKLMQVAADGPGREANEAEARAICELLEKVSADKAAQREKRTVMVITPYRQQEEMLNERLDALREKGGLANVDVEVCTLDRCQGREAAFVIVSLVRSTATVFLDMPKRWNVALTRAREGLFVVGDVDAYRREARQMRADPRSRSSSGGPPRPQMSVLARIVEAYDQRRA